MLREWIASLVTPSTSHAKHLGYVREGVAIEARHRRQRKAWAEHLSRSRAFILSEAESCPGREVAVVLGSGALLDVPLAELAQRFRQVWLLDLFHPLSTRRLARRFANVTLLEHDLLGIDQDGRPEPAPERLSGWRQRLPQPDFVVSVNLLTQLPLRPLERWGEELGVAWMTAVMQAHLQDLRQGPGLACLVSEWRHRSLDAQGRETEREDVLAGFDLPPMADGWVWRLAPPGEMPDGSGLEMDVGGYRLSQSRAA